VTAIRTSWPVWMRRITSSILRTACPGVSRERGGRIANTLGADADALKKIHVIWAGPDKADQGHRSWAETAAEAARIVTRISDQAILQRAFKTGP